jgi:uncharacterized membrane protein
MEIINNNPKYFGIIICILGIFILLGAIFNSNFIFGDGSEPKSFNLKKIRGWVSMFGRTVTRIIVGIFGIFMLIFGIFWFFAYPQK